MMIYLNTSIISYQTYLFPGLVCSGGIVIKNCLMLFTIVCNNYCLSAPSVASYILIYGLCRARCLEAVQDLHFIGNTALLIAYSSEFRLS